MAQIAEIHSSGSRRAVLLAPSLLTMSRRGKGRVTGIAVMVLCRVTFHTCLSRRAGLNAVSTYPRVSMWHRKAVTCLALALRVTAETGGLMLLCSRSVRRVPPAGWVRHLGAVARRAQLAPMTQRAVCP